MTALLVASAALGAEAKPGSFVEFDARAKAGERLNVVFFGASLTWGANASDPAETSYRAVMRDRFEQEYPAAHFRFQDAAIGGTGSQLGAFRLERDVPIPELQERLLDHGAVLAYVSDVGVDDPRFRAVQRLVLQGRVPGMALEPDQAVELVLTPLDADGERRLDFAVNGHVASAVLTRRLGQHTLTVNRIPGVTVTPRFVGGVLADVRLETQTGVLTAE